MTSRAPNGFCEKSLTSQELNKLIGMEKDSFIQWRGDFHQIGCIAPLRIDPVWVDTSNGGL